MILFWLIAILILGGILAALAARIDTMGSRYVSLAALGIDAVLVLVLWIQYSGHMSLVSNDSWMLEYSQPWIPQLGIDLYLALDGLSLILIALTVFLGIISVLASWTEIQERVGFFHFNLLWILAGIIGVFLALDLFLFYFFWELMLVPMYFLIAIWGHENRYYAAVKFFIFTQFSGLLLLFAILALYFIHGNNTGTYTFQYQELLKANLSPVAAGWIMGGFLSAFLVKLPAFPVHTWLPDAHTQAPTAGSVILAGLLLKTGAYGLLRFVIPMFPDAVNEYSWILMLLGVLGILYGAVLAYAQTDLKRLVAYTSFSHMGFVLLGVFALNQYALQGTVLQIVCHGISTGALFILAGALQERYHTRNMMYMGGFWRDLPRFGSMAMFFAMASLGLPGLGNFIGEFLILLGVYHVNLSMTVFAALGLILAPIYALWMVQCVFHGAPVKLDNEQKDLVFHEWIIFASLAFIIVWLGVYPQWLLNLANPAIELLTSVSDLSLFSLLKTVASTMMQGGFS